MPPSRRCYTINEVLSILEEDDVFISSSSNQQQNNEDSADEESLSANNLSGNQLNSTGEATVYKGNKQFRILSVSDEIGEQSERFDAIAPPNTGRRTRMKVSEAQNISNIVEGKRKTRGLLTTALTIPSRKESIASVYIISTYDSFWQSCLRVVMSNFHVDVCFGKFR